MEFVDPPTGFAGAREKSAIVLEIFFSICPIASKMLHRPGARVGFPSPGGVALVVTVGADVEF